MRKISSPRAKSKSKALAVKQPVWFIGFLVLIALVPLPFGSNRPWAGDMLGLCAGLLLLLCARDLYRQPSLWPAGAPWQRLAYSAAALTAVVAWGFVQTLDWFPHPLWDSAAQTLALPVKGSISLTPDRLGECALRIFAYAACFLLAFFSGRDADRAKKLLRTVAITGAAYAFYGLAIQSSGANLVLWYPKWAYWDELTSTFVNKNSYATYAGLGLVAGLGLLWRHFSKRPQLRFSVIALERLGLRDLYPPILCLTIFGALLLSASRGGITSGCAGCFAFLVALAVNQGWRGKKWLLILLPGAAFLLGFASFSADVFLDHIDPKAIQDDSALRLGAYQTIARALADNPWQGFGLGAFESAFRLYRNADIHEWFEHAHDDYLELAMELGIPAALLYVSAIAAMISCCLEGVGGAARRRKNEIYAIVAVGASVVAGVHSLVDFSMEIPAVAATYAALLGLGVAQSWSSKDIVGEENGRL